MRSIYLYIVSAVLILGFLMPQRGPKRIYYITVVTLIHSFVSGFRYCHLTGDLIKYQTTFHIMGTAGWFDSILWSNGKNFGFHYFLKLLHVLTNGNYQIVLLLTAIVIHGILAYLVFRYSPSPWFSFLVWNCLGFYIFGFSALKQSLAMAFVMLSFDAIARRNASYYLICIAIAGSIHLPALVFLPAYWLCRVKVNAHSLLFYLLAGILVFICKDVVVSFLHSFYYEDSVTFAYSGSLGNRFVMIALFALFSVLFSGFGDPRLEYLFPIMAISALLQMLSGFGNLFTRLADYYFQLSVLYLPLVFRTENVKQYPSLFPLFPFNRKSKYLLTAMVCMFLVWFYYRYNLSITIANPLDDYLNYRFLWDVTG